MERRANVSAGLLLYKFNNRSELMIFLVHPGGPFWKYKDKGAWSIPKGECNEKEEFLDTAIRELREETGIVLEKSENYIELGSVKQKSRKIVRAWAVKGDWTGLLMCKSHVTIEYP